VFLGAFGRAKALDFGRRERRIVRKTLQALALLAAAVVVRTALEDRTLRRELAGYAEYAKRTRYRLLPGIW